VDEHSDGRRAEGPSPSIEAMVGELGDWRHMQSYRGWEDDQHTRLIFGKPVV